MKIQLFLSLGDALQAARYHDRRIKAQVGRYVYDVYPGGRIVRLSERQVERLLDAGYVPPKETPE